ncbi:16966_t:CDS:1 [Racocetra persica]|uniref:16966_t:CDS:1 n=1 Tax=Racocetra persica TaxID=160502 RepID=A0ACA9MU51_9GLOM|nr:16966_t:CDS:1 [Racocetra persica]
MNVNVIMVVRGRGEFTFKTSDILRIINEIDVGVFIGSTKGSLTAKPCLDSRYAKEHTNLLCES